MSDSNRLSPRPPPPPPPKEKQPRFLGALLFTHMTQGLTTTLPYVIAVYMVRDFLAAQDPDGLPPLEEHVGTLTGLLGATFCAAQLITSYPLGLLSDIVGRRLIIILGNISCIIGVLFFGLSSNYSQAVLSRLIAGFFNAIIGAEKAMIGESLDSAAQAKTMGHISLMWGVGTMIGPTMGGVLSNPCNVETGVLRWWSRDYLENSNSSSSSSLELTPAAPIDSSNSTGSLVSSGNGGGICSADGLLFKKPYFLPCLAASFLSVVATILTIFYLDETLPSKKTRVNSNRRGYMRLSSRDGRVESPDDEDFDDDKDFVGEVQLVETVLQIDNEEGVDAEDRLRKEGCTIEDSAEALKIHNNANETHHSKFGQQRGGARRLQKKAAPPTEGPLLSSLPWHKQRNVLLCLAGYALIAFCFILLDELIPIYASARIVDGGLGFPTSTLALPLAFGGFILVVWALFGFPWMHARLGAVKCTTIGLIQTAPMALMIPAATFAWAPPAATMWLAMGFKAIAGTNAFTGCIILVNAVAPKESLGAVNGVGQTLASAVRAAGPALGGLFWAWSLTFFKYLNLESSWGHQFLPFLFAAIVALATLGVYAKVKLPMETQIIAGGQEGGEEGARSAPSA
jgi:MFS family permease